MSIWKKPIDLDILNATSKNTMMEHLQIVYTDLRMTHSLRPCQFAALHISLLGCFMVALLLYLQRRWGHWLPISVLVRGVTVWDSTSMRTIFEPCAAGTLLARRSRFTWVYRLKYGKSKSRMNADVWFARAV